MAMSAKNMFYKENYSFSNSEEKAFARDELVYNVTEDLLVILEDMEISKKELARRLGKSRSYVSQILSGSRNMTLGSLSDICFALGFKPKIELPVQNEPESHVDHFVYDIQWLENYIVVYDKVTHEIAHEIAHEITRSPSKIIDRSNELFWRKEVA
jgi:transcriptional regulator with XRE-family HTH domain